jgi:hypothetical protein
LRPHFLESTNVDVLAFHEGIADIVAIFQHFTFPDALREQIRRSSGDVAAAGLVELAAQFGWATGSGGALRRALETTKPDATRMEKAFEPHERGAILVAAVFDAFRTVYARRTADLRRIAGVEGEVEGKDLHPDLLERLVQEATRTAQSVLAVCLRAFDYMPPVDPNFGDYLRALVTADYELSPDDDQGIRAAVISAFRTRGIYPKDVVSFSQDSIMWPRFSSELALPDDLVKDILFNVALGLWGEEDGGLPLTKEELARDLSKDIFMKLHEFARRNADLLGLKKVPPGDQKTPIKIDSFHSASRVGQDGRTVFEIFVNFVQTQRDTENPSEDLGGIPVRAGCTLIASANGRVRYVIAKSFESPNAPAKEVRRIDRQKAFVAEFDARDPLTPYRSDADHLTRMRARASLAALHGRRGR